MPNSVTVSFIVPCYNAPDFLARLLRELPRQTYPHELIEVVIVDDGSTESPYSVFAAAEAQFVDFARFSLVRHAANKGRAGARNSGIVASSGEVLIFCDADCYPAPDFIEKMVSYHAQYRLVAVRANMRILPVIRQRSAFLRYRDSRYIGARTNREKRGLSMNNLPPTYFATGGISVERASIMAVGLFDETFSGYGGEDEEMGFRLFCSGVRIIFGADAVIWDADDGLTLQIAYSNYKRYGADSGGVLFAKYPEYCRYSPFSRLEPIDTHSDSIGVVIKKILLRLVMLPWLARYLCRALAFIDQRPLPFDPPGIFYKYILSASYLEGVYARKNRRPEY